MTKQEQIKEMAKAMEDFELQNTYKCDIELAEHLYHKGYRKYSKDSVVLSREEYQELEDLRRNHAKDLINANKSYEEHIKDIKLEYGNHIKNLEKIIDRQSKDINSQADRLIDLKEELENKGKETAREILREITNEKNKTEDIDIGITYDLFEEQVKQLAEKYGVEVEL